MQSRVLVGFLESGMSFWSSGVKQVPSLFKGTSKKGLRIGGSKIFDFEATPLPCCCVRLSDVTLESIFSAYIDTDSFHINYYYY